MRVISKTDIGLLREENQDYVIVKTMPDETVIAVVCDGMGGMNGGGVASELACNEIFNRIVTSYRSNAEINSLRNLMLTSITAANILVYERASINTENIGMGTTCVVAIVKEKIALVMNVGDSRAYLIDEDETVQVTTDHTMIRMLLDEKKITEEEALTHPHRNVITRAIGIDEKVDVDYYEIDLDKGAKMMLCSDGLSNYCTIEYIHEIMRNNTLQEACDIFVEHAKNAGGKDNITVAVIGN